jgi:2-methylcitrate dehydratase
MRIGIKAYPCFAGAQSAVAAGIAMHRSVSGDIARLSGNIRVALANLPIVRRQLSDPGRVEPHSREAADHSLHFLIAVSLIDGTFGLRQFDGERWHDPTVRALMARLEMTTDDDLTRRAGDAYPCALHAVGGDGRRYDVEALQPPGYSTDGLDENAVVEKFSRLTAENLAPAARDRIVDSVMALETADTCAGLMQALRPSD